MPTDLNRETEYLMFRELPNQDKKTRLWLITSRRHGDVLGRVRWHGPWRNFALESRPHVLFNRGCLADIDQFLADAYTDWRETRAYEQKGSS